MIALDLTPIEEARIFQVARQTGLAPAEYVKKLINEHLPPVETVSAAPAPAVDEENAAAIAQLQAWAREEATDDPEEIRQSEAELAELLHNLNRNRIESGERPLFP